MDIQGIEGGKYWPEAISKAILECRILLLFMSPASMASDNVRNEVQIAFEERKVIVILMLEDVEIPPAMRYQLAGRQRIDSKLPDWRKRTVEALENPGTSPSQTEVEPTKEINLQTKTLTENNSLESSDVARKRVRDGGIQKQVNVQPTGEPRNRRVNPYIAVAIIGLIGTIVVALINQSPAFIQVLVKTPTPSSTATIVFTPTSAPTREPSPSSTSTEIPPTFTVTPFICPYQGETDDETIVSLIKAEAYAVNGRSLDIILAIYSPNAIFYQYDTVPPKIWYGPVDRYESPFKTTEYKDVEHFDILPAVPVMAGETDAYYTSGSRGNYRTIGGDWTPFDNGSLISPTPTQYGSDHWTLKKDEKGCWLIVRMDFNAGHIEFP
jgi:hypothetical protein